MSDTVTHSNKVQNKQKMNCIIKSLQEKAKGMFSDKDTGKYFQRNYRHMSRLSTVNNQRVKARRYECV